MKKELIERFESVFKVSGAETFFAPGRINLIGEHTDYNGGYVFPCAISLGTYAAAKPRTDNIVRLYSANFADLGIIEFSLSDLSYNKQDDWANYPKGMIRAFIEAGYPVENGFDMYVYGNIPNGAGLSSSASLEMLTAVALKSFFAPSINKLDYIKLGQRVENEFIGVNSGIMDQFAVGHAEEDKAILLDCKTLNYDMVPPHLEGYKIVIINTNKRRELADSKYNERRSECEQALAELQKEVAIDALGDLTEAEFLAHQQAIKSETRMRRARHAVTENERTKLAAAALKANDLVKFGQLMNESHQSLRDDYEVTGVELDMLAETAWQIEGVLGARMTGAGFGGCAIAIVAANKVADFKKQVGSIYEEKIGYPATFYIADSSGGAAKFKEE